MSESLHWTWEASIKEGEEAGFKALAREWAEIAEKDPGTLQSQWCISADGVSVRVDQWFVNAAAAWAQFQTNTCWGRLDDHLQPTGMVVCGKSSKDLEFLHGHGAKFLEPFE